MGAASVLLGPDTTDWIERGAILASVVCLMHCVGLPLVIAALPAAAAIVRVPKNVHIWILALAVQISGGALALGFKSHGAHKPLIVGMISLGLLAIGAPTLLGVRFETLVTIFGSLLLATAHIFNWRGRHAKHVHG